jgi:TRAP-type C4-dicarboxylate transport system permease small subunit
MTTTDLPAGGALALFDRAFARLENLFNGFAAASIFVLMVLATIQVVSRKLFNLPIPGYIDFAEQSIAIFAFMGAAYCQRLGGHVRMELFLDKMRRGRALWLAEGVTTLAALFIIVVLTIYSFSHFQRAWTIGDSTIDINLPVWPSKLLVSLALGFLAVRLLIQLFGFLRLMIWPQATPVAVPLMASVAEQAEREIRESEERARKNDERGRDAP